MGFPNLAKGDKNSSPLSWFKILARNEAKAMDLATNYGEKGESSTRVEDASKVTKNSSTDLSPTAEDNGFNDLEKVRICKTRELGKCDKMNEEMPKRINPELEEGEILPTSKTGTTVEECPVNEDLFVTSTQENVTDKEEMNVDISKKKDSGNEGRTTFARSPKKKIPKQLRDLGPINGSTRSRKIEYEGKGREYYKLANLCANYALFGSFSWDDLSLNKVNPSFINTLNEESSL
ncbi:hypothetical protein MA16_Dca017966 [Dendrobium catenatum]|uniref:Uncharacterized protein n=1 Tax=Dendrobium catenatum TaxID=906689 RepID=A0A2I0W262_9ASPA|nr:hypothetical protein MA16_Dca017966 [Dendrobium catenatum]